MKRWLQGIRWRSHLATLAMVLAVFGGVHLWQTRDVPTGPAPDLNFTLLQPDGSRVETSLAEWRAQHAGRAVAVYVWAEWCPICKLQAHNVQSLLDANLPVLTIAMRSGTADQVALAMRKRHIAWPAAIDPRGEMAQALGFNAVPAFIVVDAQGQLRGASVGYTSELGMRWRLWWPDAF